MDETKISILGLFVNLFLGISKIIIGIISKSSAILADGLHSGMDVISSGISYFGIKVSKKPADKKHPYGHNKAEVISGLIITMILFLAGLGIIYEAVLSFLNPEKVIFSLLAVSVILTSVILNFIMFKIKTDYGKKNNIISLISDGVHDKADVLSSGGVLIGFLITPYFVYADSIIAFLIGFYIIKESFELGKDATDSLLDVSADDDKENKIKKIIKNNKNVILKDLKTQKRGNHIFAQIKISLPKNLKVEDASNLTKKIEKDLIDSVFELDYVSIEIESHNVGESYYRGDWSTLGKGYGWQRKGKQEGNALGTGGYCICEKCDYKIKHKLGVPCYKIKCPKCSGKMKRENVTS